MEKKEVVIDNPVTVAGLTVVPVAKVLLNYSRRGGGTSFFGFKEPVSVVVVSQSEKRAFRITGEEVTLGQLTQEVPSIAEILAKV